MHTFRAIRALGNTANMATAVSISAKTWRGEGRREDRHTAPNTAALRDMELDALHNKGQKGVCLKQNMAIHTERTALKKHVQEM